MIIDTDLSPKLMEVTFSPNLESIVNINKNFVDELLDGLFLGEEHNLVRII